MCTWFPHDLITYFTVDLVCLRCWTFTGQGADYEHDRISKLGAEWQPQGTAETLMTCVNGAWLFFWLLSGPEVILSRCCPVSLCYPVVNGQARVGLICTLTRGSVPAFAQPLKDDKIQWWTGVGSRRPAGCSLEDFNFVFLSLPFSSLPSTMFGHSCVHHCWLQERKQHICEGVPYVTEWLIDSAASIINKMH